MNRETTFVDSFGQRLTIQEGAANGFEVCSQGNSRHFTNDRAPNVALAVLKAAGWEKSAAAVQLRDIICTIECPHDIKIALPDEYVRSINADDSLSHAEKHELIERESTNYQEQVVNATVLDPDAVAAKALEALNGAWSGSKPYPPAIHEAILALEKHAETLMEEAARESLEHDALALCNAFHGQSVTSWSKLSDHAKEKWAHVAQKARELNLGILGE